MGLRINRYMCLKLCKYYEPVAVCSNSSTQTSSFFTNYHQNVNYHRKFMMEIQNPLKILKRNYALKLYSQFIPESDTFGNSIIEYIKTRNNLELNPEIPLLSNVFDTKSAVKQIESIVMHSVDPNPDDVIKLFSLYKSYDRSKLDHTFRIKKAIMSFRVQSTVLLMSHTQLQQFAIALRNNFHHRLEFFKQISQFTFEECVSRAETCESLSDALKYFIIGLELFGNGISSKVGYSEFMSVFEKFIHEATPIQLAQIMYFLGYAKTSKKADELKDLSISVAKLLESRMEDISLMDAGLLANGLFKLQLKTDVDFSSSMSSKIVKEIDPVTSTVSLDKSKSFALVSIIKYMRISLYKDNGLLQAMKTLIEHLDEDSCNPQLVCHVLALYANANFYDHGVYTTLGNLFFKFLRSSNDVIRIKDISRFMWAMSHAQHQCKIEDFNLVIETLLKFATTGELLNHSSHVVDATLALAMLNIYSDKLMKICLHEDIFKSFIERERNRYLSRLLVLSEVQKMAFPSLNLTVPAHAAKDAPQRKLSNECRYRRSMKRIGIALNWLTEQCGTQIFELKFLVPHINYCSVALTGEAPVGTHATSDIGKRVLENLASLKYSKIAIDIDDANTSLNDGERTSGLENLKRKLMEEDGWDVRVLNVKDVDNCGEDSQAIAALLLQTIMN